MHNESAALGKLELDVIIVGGGIGGMYAIHRLRELGLSVRAYEAGSDIGGTWYWNRYPGCRCDVESMEYSFSFSAELEQDWDWPERYGTQPQILEYLEHVAKRFDLRKDIALNARVLSAHFDNKTTLWTIKTDGGETVSAPFIVMATGNLSTPRVPNYPGLKDFGGDWYHTGMWPHEGVDFTGKRVGVIGTGSSGVQSIPIIARQAEHVHVFQRTPQFVLPARNGPQDPEQVREHKATYRERRKAALETPFGIAGHPPPTKTALEDDESARREKYDTNWAIGGQIRFLFSYTDLLLNKESNDTAADYVREQIRAIVDDPQTAEKLIPHDHPMGTKRLILDTGYFETFNRESVELVDARATPIRAITANGLCTTTEEFELDALVFATGFDAMTGAMMAIDIRTDDGADIPSKWANGPQTYLGIMMSGFPNLFMITGPQSPGVKSQMILSIEQHVDFIARCLESMQSKGHTRVDAAPQAEADWVAHNTEVAQGTLYPLANSWYMGANIPGKPRVFMPYVGGVQNYRRRCEQVIANDFEGLQMSGGTDESIAEVREAVGG
jgi:cyclohexanone monooxygenase